LKALLTTLFFLGLMAAVAAQWMDGLVDTTLLHQSLQEGLYQRRRDWGQMQDLRAQQRGLRRPGQKRILAKLPLGALFQADDPRQDPELAWMQSLLARLCLTCHPSYLMEERQALTLVQHLLLRIGQARQPNRPPSSDPFAGFTGKLSLNEDLMAIPLEPQMRAEWQALLIGSPPCSGALLDWIDVSSFQPVPFESLPEPVLVAIFGVKGHEEMQGLRPDLRDAALAKWLDPNGISALRRLVDLTGGSEEASRFGPATG
jgi:hypothetical protein